MSDKPTELTEFFLREENSGRASEDLTLILNKIVHCGMSIAAHVKTAGLSDIGSVTGDTNVHAEEMIKLDRFSNDLLTDTLSTLSTIYGLGSEEMAEIHYVNKDQGRYLVFFDPLDGSSNTDCGIPVGTIFSIYKHKPEELLQKGSAQIAAGYLLYGSSVILVYSTGHGVNGFTLDPSTGIFLLSHPDLKIPDSGKTYSVNEARNLLWDAKLTNFIQALKKDDSYTLRYVGSMVADVHRTLIKGGIFIYPADSKLPLGKLRLLFEVNPMSFLVAQAGGMALAEMVSPLEIKPASLHVKSSVALGSKEQMKLYQAL